MSQDDRRRAGFRERTPLAAAREAILSAVDPHDRTDRLPVGRADGRALAEPVAAREPVPHYERAAMDGFAVRAADTFGAGERAPELLSVAGEAPGAGPVGAGEAVRVHTGSELPAGADAVVMVEHVERVGEELEVYDAVAEGENVAPVGEDVAAGEELFDPGHQLCPSDLGLLKAAGVDRVAAYEPPTVGVVPTGEELVQRDPAPGEVVETNGLTVSRLADRWGAVPTYRNVVTDDREALRAAVQRDLTKDVVVTTGGSSVGERDLIPEVIGDVGEVLVHGVALEPGHPVALGVVQGRPVLALPGYPVACIVTAVQLLRPVLKRAGNLPAAPPPRSEATLSRRLPSEPGTRTFARVRTRETEAGREATPVRTGGAGVLSSVARADGWVVVPEGREGYPAGETVAVEGWEWSP